MNNHFQVGVTGGIGAGKSVVTKIFSIFGIPVYDSDTRAKQLMVEDNELIEAITNAFGEQSYENGVLNRKFLAAHVFNQPEALAKLNNMVHPKVGEDYLKWLLSQKNIVTIKEAALLFETGIAEKLDFIVVVTAPDQLRIRRVQQRDDRGEDQIKRIISNQWPQDKTAKLADSVIVNDETKPLMPQVLELAELIKRKASLR